MSAIPAFLIQRYKLTTLNRRNGWWEVFNGLDHLEVEVMQRICDRNGISYNVEKEAS